MTLKITLKKKPNRLTLKIERTKDMSNAEYFLLREISVWLSFVKLFTVVSGVFQCIWTFWCDFQCHILIVLSCVFVFCYIINILITFCLVFLFIHCFFETKLSVKSMIAHSRLVFLIVTLISLLYFMHVCAWCLLIFR